MCSKKHLKFSTKSPVVCNPFGVVLAALLAIALFYAPAALAQSSGSDQQQSPPNKQQQDQVPAEAGGPGGESGSIAVPKKGNTDEPPPPPKPKPTDIPQFSLHVDVPVVTVDAQILQKNGLPIALPLEQAQEHFKIWEDGVPQKIQSVTKSKASITAVLLVEFAATNYNFMVDALNGSYAFASMLQPQDWIGIVDFDVKPHVLLDFTQNRGRGLQCVERPAHSGFSDDRHLSRSRCLRHARPPGSHPRAQRAGRDRQRTRHLQQNYARSDDQENQIHPQRQPSTASAPGEASIEFMQTLRAEVVSNMSNYLLDYAQAKNQMATFARIHQWTHLCSRIIGEFPGHLSRDRGRYSRSVHHHLQADQYQAGRHLSQAKS